MRLKQISSFINPAQINVELLSQMSSQVTPYTVENVLPCLERAIPALSITRHKRNKTIVVKILGVEEFEPLKISSPEDLSVTTFDLLTVGQSYKIEELIKCRDFSGALSKVSQLFYSAKVSVSKVPEAAIGIVKKLSEFCQSQRKALDAIAQWLKADSYSVEMSLPPTITFNFTVAEKKTETEETAKIE